MPNQLPLKWKLIVQLKRAIDVIIGPPAVGLLKVLRRADPDRSADRASRLLRRIGPLLPAHRVGRANLVAAFPEKSPEEIEKILLGVWDNLGRVAAEFAHIDRIIIHDPARPERSADPDTTISEATYANLQKLGNTQRPCLVFAAHLANWEIPATAPFQFGFKTSILYRRPNIGAASDAIVAMRERCMGTMVAAGLDAPLKLGRALGSGGTVALLVAQHNPQGVGLVCL